MALADIVDAGQFVKLVPLPAAINRFQTGKISRVLPQFLGDIRWLDANIDDDLFLNVVERRIQPEVIVIFIGFERSNRVVKRGDVRIKFRRMQR